MIELFGKPALNSETVKELQIPQEQQNYLNQIIAEDEMLRYILGQEMWVFPEFDKKFCRIRATGKYGNTKPQGTCLEEMEKVFGKVRHFPQVKQIIIFRYNLRVLNKSSIINMQFKNLKEMHLQLNKTLNIETLGWFDGQNLEKLSISQNYLTCIKPLQKLMYKNLEHINISQNLLNSGNSKNLQRIKLTSKNAKQIYFDAEQIQHVNGKSFYLQDLSFVFKLQGVEEDMLRCMAKNRIHQEKVWDCFKRIAQ